MSEDFGLLYASTFTGSMVGTSPVVFAVWSYVVANGYGGQVDLNPRLLAAIFGTTAADVEAAIAFHCAPDPDSRSDADGGRRLRHVSGVRYEVVNHEVYKNARALEEKRASDRARKRSSREQQGRTVDVPIVSAPGCDLSQKNVTERDPLLSSPSDLISSDPEGVQGEGSRVPPADYAPTAAQRERCAQLGHDVDKLLAKFKRTEFRRAYTRWDLRFDEWIETEPKPPPKPSKSPKGPPWVDDGAMLLARELGRDLAAMSKRFEREHHPRPRLLNPNDSRTAFKEFLVKAPPDVAAA